MDDENPSQASLDIHYYSQEGAFHFLDVTGIQCLVGQVKNGYQWAVVDRSGSLAWAVYLDDSNT